MFHVLTYRCCNHHKASRLDALRARLRNRGLLLVHWPLKVWNQRTLGLSSSLRHCRPPSLPACLFPPSLCLSSPLVDALLCRDVARVSERKPYCGPLYLVNAAEMRRTPRWGPVEVRTAQTIYRGTSAALLSRLTRSSEFLRTYPPLLPMHPIPSVVGQSTVLQCGTSLRAVRT